MSDLFIRAACMDWNGVGEDSYLWDIPAIAGVDRVDFDSPVTCFVGENGSGKSTLLEAIAVSAGFNPEGGTKNYSFSTYDSHSELCDRMRLVRGPKKPRWGVLPPGGELLQRGHCGGGIQPERRRAPASP